jgi:hypothetical protein
MAGKHGIRFDVRGAYCSCEKIRFGGNRETVRKKFYEHMRGLDPRHYERKSVWVDGTKPRKVHSWEKVRRVA